jgi:hypothetical protein
MTFKSFFQKIFGRKQKKNEKTTSTNEINK